MKFKINSSSQNSCYNISVFNQVNSTWNQIPAANQISDAFIQLSDAMSTDANYNIQRQTICSTLLHRTSFIEVDVSNERVKFEQGRVENDIEEEDDNTDEVINTIQVRKSYSGIEDFNPAYQAAVQERLNSLGILLRQLAPVSSVGALPPQANPGQPQHNPIPVIHIAPPHSAQPVRTIKVKSPARQELDQIVRDIANGSKTLSALKDHLINVVAVRDPRFFSECAAFIYQHDHRGWEQTPVQHRLDEPGTKGFTHNNQHFPKELYGEFRLHSASPEELYSILSRLP